MEKFESVYCYRKGKNLYYTEEFKSFILKQLKDYPELSINSLLRLYDIRGTHTIDRWLKKESEGESEKEFFYLRDMKKNDPKPASEPIKPEAMSSDNELTTLKIKLAEALAINKKQEAIIDGLEALITVTNRMYKTDLKKKYGTKRSQS